MKNSRDTSMRRISLTRRSILRAGLGGTVAFAFSNHNVKLRRRFLSANAATPPVQTAATLAGDEASRELAIQGNGSIAIVTDSSTSTFGGYLAEILSAEGVRDYSIFPLSSLNSVIQNSPRAIILAPSSPTSANITTLQNYVSSGGGLVVLRPDSGLNNLLGITSESGSISQGYLRITDTQVAGGLYSQTIQFHGTSNKYSLNGAQQIAELYTSRTSTTGLPAATLSNFGSGRAAMMSFDLAQSVAEIRQGNPAQANQDTDGDGIVRSIDIYRNWTDLERSNVPQADIQQRLLVRLIDAVSGYPTPRLWYFPGNSRSVFVPTGDAHGNPQSYFQALIDAFSQRGIGMTFFVPTTSPPPSAVSQWISQGFDFSIHPYVDQGYGSGFSDNLSDFVNDYGFSPATARTHQVRWTGWSTAAEIESQFGIEMDFNSYQWSTWLSNSSGQARGYLSGSGIPMRFAASDGDTLSIFQQHTNLVDEELAPEVGVADLTLTEALSISHQTIDDCIDQFHTAIVTQFHVDYFNFGDVNSWVLGTTDYALQRGATPLTAAEWLAFVKSRAATNISDVTWAANALLFTVSGGGSNRTVLVPLSQLGSALTSVTRNGSNASYSVLTVDGRSMAAISATNGNYKATYEADTTAPVISNIVVTSTANTATVTWTTDEAATSIVDYGLTPSLGSQASVAGLATSHSVTLTGLTPATTYSYQVTSADASNNTSSSEIQSFTTTPAGAPTLSGIAPSSGQSGTSHNVTISGTNFVNGISASLGTTALQNVALTNSTTIQAVVPASLPVGQHNLEVTNPDTQSATLANAYTSTAPPPDLVSVAPPVATAGQQVTLSGAGFITGATVRFNSTAAMQTTVTSSSSATAQIPTSLAGGTYSVTLTNPDQQSDTLTNALTISALPTIGHTTVADFTPGVFTNTAVISGGQAGDGAVVLASNGWLDNFDQPNLDPNLWTSNTWQTGGSIAISTGNLNVNGAWIRSATTVGIGRVNMRATFTGAPWLNIGLSRTDDLDNPWFLFGVPGWDTSQVYVRYNFSGGFANIPLPDLLGAPHTYSIVKESGLVRFLVDDQEVHQVATGALGGLATWVSSGAIGSPLSVDSVEIVTYQPQGSYLSPALDAGQSANWQQLIISAPSVPSTSFVVRVRSSTFGSNWSAWSTDMSSFPAQLALPVGRYLQYQIDLQSTDGTTTPIIEAVSASYQTQSGPVVSSVVVSPASVNLERDETQQFIAEVSDTDGNPLPDAPVTWSVTNGGGTINASGLFTAGATGGTFTNTVVASSNGITGSASVTVTVPPAPQITDVSPPAALAGDTVTVSGQNFISGAQVHVGSTQTDDVNVSSATTLTFTVPTIANDTYSVTVTNPDGQFGSLQNALTISSLNWLNHTSLSDFQAGTHASTAAIQGGVAGDGAVILANQGSIDDFNDASLNGSLWTSGLWDPSGSLTISGGALTARGGWVRSTASLTSGAASGRLTFSNTGWQNFGLSRTDDLDAPWFLFGVPGWDTSQVYVRFNYNGGLGNVPIPGLIGEPHDYAIQVGGGIVSFLVDDQQVHQVNVPALPTMAVWLSVGSTIEPGTVADSLGSVIYPESGAFTGQTFDAGQYANWQELIVDATTMQGTTLSFRARTSTNSTTWSTWSTSTSTSPAHLALPGGRYLQYELNLATTKGSATPLIQVVSGGYTPSTPPGPASMTITPTNATLIPGDTQQFSAQVFDISGNLITDAPLSWSVEAGGGEITSGGMFTAGSTLGNYADTVVATSNSLNARATVNVIAPPSPHISNVNPSSAVVGASVTITGDNFASGATVALDSIPVSDATVVNATTITFTVPQVPAGMYSVVVTNPSEQSDILSDGLTVSTPSVPVTVSQSTGSEFGQGSLVNTEVTTFGDGEVRLTASFLDEFNGSALGSAWNSGSYGSGGSASVNNGQAAVTNGWIQSTASFGETTATARLTYNNNGTPYLNFGFGSAGSLDYPWFLFGIPGFDTNRIYARTNVPGDFYLDQVINGVTLNQPHEYSIRRRTGGVDYLIDGQVVATHTVNSPTTTAPLAAWFSSGNSGQTLSADWFRVDQYPSNGTFTSNDIDAGVTVTLQSVAGDIDLPTGTSASIRVRTSTNGTTWSAWSSSAAISGSSVNLEAPDGRYVQYELTLTSGGESSPEIRSVTISGTTS